MVSVTAALRIFEKVHNEDLIWLFFPSLPPSGCENIVLLDVFTGGKEVEREKSIDRKQHQILTYAINDKYPMTESQIKKILCYQHFFSYF